LRTVDINQAAMILNRAINHRHTQACALTHAFGGKKRCNAANGFSAYGEWF